MVATMSIFWVAVATKSSKKNPFLNWLITQLILSVSLSPVLQVLKLGNVLCCTHGENGGKEKELVVDKAAWTKKRREIKYDDDTF